MVEKKNYYKTLLQFLMIKVLKNNFVCFFIMLIVEKIILFLHLEFNFVGLKGYLPTIFSDSVS